MKPVHTEALPLFSEPPCASLRPERALTATQVGLQARDATAGKHAKQMAALIPIARELAAKAGESGVTVADIRLVAERQGLLTGTEKGRELSWLGALPEAAGLQRTGQYRRSFLARSNGNLQMAWRLPDADGPSAARDRPDSRDGVSGDAA